MGRVSPQTFISKSHEKYVYSLCDTVFCRKSNHSQRNFARCLNHESISLKSLFERYNLQQALKVLNGSDANITTMTNTPGLQAPFVAGLSVGPPDQAKRLIHQVCMFASTLL